MCDQCGKSCVLRGMIVFTWFTSWNNTSFLKSSDRVYTIINFHPTVPKNLVITIDKHNTTIFSEQEIGK